MRGELPVIVVDSTSSSPAVIDAITDIEWDWLDRNPGSRLYVQVQYG
jgi:hypothetical protein